MKGSNVKAIVMGAALVLSACTSGRQGVNLEQPQQPAGQAGQQGGPAGKDDGSLGGNSSIANKGSMQFTLSQKQLASYAALDLANLNYKFSYLSTNQAEKITFDAAGKAQLSFKNLEADKAGTLTLEILEGETVKLRGIKENVTLTKGINNSVELVLKKIDGGGDTTGSTDLTIDVTLDDGSTTPPTDTTVTPPTDTTVTPPTDTTITPPTDTTVTTPPTDTTVTPPTDTTVTTPPAADPLADWDGKSFRGNAKFKVVPVES